MTKKKIGAPTKYTEALGKRICDLISTHPHGLPTIIRMFPDLPDRQSIYNWLQLHRDFFDSYMRAKEQQAHLLADEVLEVTNDIPTYEDSHLGDFIEDGNTLAPAEAALHDSMRDVVKDVLDSLTPREAKVLRMRFGVEMSTDHTLEEVGKQFDVTRERIRQIEAKALRKMRHPSRSDKLKTFLEED